MATPGNMPLGNQKGLGDFGLAFVFWRYWFIAGTSGTGMTQIKWPICLIRIRALFWVCSICSPVVHWNV